MADRGKFLVLEGGEGVGKSTQLALLRDRLMNAGKSVVTTREPGGTDGAEAIRRLILEGEGDRWTAQTEALLFAAARADHVARLIRPVLAEGSWVVCDRFLESSRAYQGLASGLGDAVICALHEAGSGGLLADRVIVLDIDTDKQAARLASRDGCEADRIERRDDQFHRQVRQAFRHFAEEEPERIRLIDASGSREDVADRIWQDIEDML